MENKEVKATIKLDCKAHEIKTSKERANKTLAATDKRRLASNNII